MVEADKNNYFNAEINDMIYEIEIREVKVFDINL